MAEYIEREAAIKSVVEAVDNGLATTADDLQEILSELPAAEVEPVIYSHWVADDEYLTCANCGESYLAGDTRSEVKALLKAGDVHKRCHGCGARMIRDKEKTELASPDPSWAAYLRNRFGRTE